MIYFLIYLFLEVMISSSIAGSIGGLNTFFEIIVSAIIGVIILQNFRFSLMESISKAQTGQITQEEFIKTNVGRAIGAALLIVPGFFTDIVGILLQFGFLTILFSKIFKFKKPSKNDGYTNNFEYTHTSFNNTTYKKDTGGGRDDIIDVEIIDDSNSINR